MLLTRCPSCQTTFRITAEALQKAGGQVRCGRCAAVFNAYAELREQPEPVAPAEPGTEQPAAAEPSSAAAPPPAAASATAAKPETPAPPETAEAREAPGAPEAPEAPTTPAAATRMPAPLVPAATSEGSASEPRFGDLSVAELVAQVERGGDEAAGASAGDADVTEQPMSAVEIDAVLEQPLGAPPSAPDEWLTAEPRRSRWWQVGAAVALLALGVQVVHHFRGELASNATIGPLLQSAYAALGSPLSPRWNLEQYQILDWVATAEPNLNGQGSLRISARVQNRGPNAQPYPHIHLELEDRRQATVGSRVFRPSEYLQTRPRRDALMEAGATAHAELEVLDPGPDAYGFELDVCIEIDAALRCGADQVFK